MDDHGARPRRLPKDHPCVVGFLDETGAIAHDRFFGVGLLKTRQPSALLRSIQKLRDRRHWYQEFKFTETNRTSLPIYQEFLDCIVAEDVGFFCFIADRTVADPVARFGSQWEAYAKLAEQLTIACIRPPELMTVLADNYSTPDEVLFEDSLKAAVNRRLRRLAVTNVCRLDSRSSDGLQAVDMLTSAVAFEYRAAAGLASATSPKARLAAAARSALGPPRASADGAPSVTASLSTPTADHPSTTSKTPDTVKHVGCGPLAYSPYSAGLGLTGPRARLPRIIRRRGAGRPRTARPRRRPRR